MSYQDIRPIFEKVWDQNQIFVPIGSEIEKESSQPVEEEKVKEEDVKLELVVKQSSKKFGGRRRKSIARKRARETQYEETSKRQKLDEEEAADYEKEKEQLRIWLTVVPDEEATIDPEILHTKYPIVDWESKNLGSEHVYKIIRANGNTIYHKTFESMLKRFDRQDLVDLHRLVMKRFEDNTPKGYNLMLWGDLNTMFEPNAEHEVWSNQQEWKMISWKLYENYGVHTLLLDEAEAKSTMAFELLKFAKSQIEEQRKSVWKNPQQKKTRSLQPRGRSANT
ncbi:hypothetical protein Tco_0036572 [Tanacetum coccineum]